MLLQPILQHDFERCPAVISLARSLVLQILLSSTFRCVEVTHVVFVSRVASSRIFQGIAILLHLQGRCATT